MPYPLAKLAYGLKCRLHELSTSVERYHLQVASGNASICPPLQKVQKTNKYLTFHYENDGATIFCFQGNGVKRIAVQKDDLLCSPKKRILVYIVNVKNFTEPFEHFLNPTFELIIYNCYISSSFVENMLKIFKGTKSICIYYNTNKEYHFDVTELVTNFPNVEKIKLNEVPFSSTWITDIALRQQHSLKELVLSMTFEEVYSYSIDDVVSFLKAQKKGFKLCIVVRDFSKDGKQLGVELSVALYGKMKKFQERRRLTELCFLINDIEKAWHTWYLPDTSTKNEGRIRSKSIWTGNMSGSVRSAKSEQNATPSGYKGNRGGGEEASTASVLLLPLVISLDMSCIRFITFAAAGLCLLSTVMAASDEATALAPYGDTSSATWLRAKRSCGSCCGGGNCCGMASPCASSCCSMPAIAIPMPAPCSCGQPGCGACGGGCPCAGQVGCPCGGGCACAGQPGCACGGGCACAGQPGCSCGQSALIIPVQQTCCKCCQPVCAPACINGGGCACGCNRGGCRRKRDLFDAINAYEAGRAVAATDLLE